MGRSKTKPTDIESQEDNTIEREVIIDDGNNQWTKDKAIILASYAHKAAGFSWMYGTDAGYFQDLNTNLNISIAILSTICAVGITSALVFIQKEFEGSQTLFYVFSIASILINLVIGCISAYKLTINFDNRISQALDKAAKFGALKRLIESQFALDPVSRDPPNVLIRSVASRFDELDREKPFLRGSTTNAWKKHLTDTLNEEEPSVIQLPVEFRDHQRGLHREDRRLDKIGQYICSM